MSDADPLANWKRLNPHAVQRRVLTDPHRFKFICAGRGSGKSELAKRWLVMNLPLARPWSDPRYGFAAPTRPQAKRLAWDDLTKLIPADWIADVSLGDLRIDTVFGSSVTIAGMNTIKRYEGKQWDGWVVDERSDVPPGTVDRSIVPMIGHRAGWIWEQGIPKRFGVGAVEFRQRYEAAARGERPESAAYEWTSGEIMPAAEVELARRTLDPADYEEQYNARWLSAGGRVFYAFDRDANVRRCEYRADRPLVIGCDFNIDPMCWVIGHRYMERPALEIIDELWVRDCNTQRALDLLWGRYSSHRGGFEFYGDAASHQRRTSASSSDYDQIEQDRRFKDAGRAVRIPRAAPAVVDRISACNRMLCTADGSRHLWIDTGCKRLIAELETRPYKQGTREPVNSEDVGHITDALGYVIFRLWPSGPTVYSPDKSEIAFVRPG